MKQGTGNKACCVSFSSFFLSLSIFSSSRPLSLSLSLFFFFFFSSSPTNLLVGKDEHDGVAQLVLGQHARQLLAGLADTLPVVAVDHKDQALRVLEVVPPQRADLVLAADVPHRKANVLVLDRLHVEA